MPSRYIASMSDAGGGAEVAAVDADREGAQRQPARVAVVGVVSGADGGQLPWRPLDEDRGRGGGDEERDDPFEGRRTG